MALLYLDEDIDDALAIPLIALHHDVLTTRQAGRRKSGDEEQLVHAASQNRILVTHNRGHFRLLQRAWRYWSDVWAVEPRPLHAGILIVPQSTAIPLQVIASEIDTFVRSRAPRRNRLYQWIPGRGWIPYG